MGIGTPLANINTLEQSTSQKMKDKINDFDLLPDQTKIQHILGENTAAKLQQNMSQ